MQLPLRFMLAGIIALATAGTVLITHPELLSTYHYNQHIIAVTHLFVLGWILTIVMGATYQLVPVVLETQLYSERLARWQFAFHALGFTGMVATFWTWNLTAVGHYGSVLGAGVILYAYNLTRTLLRAPRWSIVATAVASSLVWLSVGVLAGLIITAGKCSYEQTGNSSPVAAAQPLLGFLKRVAKLPAHFDQISTMHAHAHLGAIGVFVMLIVGISYKLLPMFTLSELQRPHRAAASVLLLNGGLAAGFVTILLRSPIKILSALLIIAGLACYGWEVRAILKARRRRSLDWGLRYFLTGLTLLVPVSLLALVLSWPGLPLTQFTGQLENLYGFLAMAGVVSFAVIGMLYKILPFLVWFRSYSASVGASKVPSLADLYSPLLQKIGYWSYLVSLAVVSLGILVSQATLVRIGLSLFGGSIALFVVNASKIISHLIRPRIEALPSRIGVEPRAATIIS